MLEAWSDVDSLDSSSILFVRFAYFYLIFSLLLFMSSSKMRRWYNDCNPLIPLMCLPFHSQLVGLTFLLSCPLLYLNFFLIWFNFVFNFFFWTFCWKDSVVEVSFLLVMLPSMWLYTFCFVQLSEVLYFPCYESLTIFFHFLILVLKYSLCGCSWNISVGHCLYLL